MLATFSKTPNISDEASTEAPSTTGSVSDEEAVPPAKGDGMTIDEDGPQPAEEDKTRADNGFVPSSPNNGVDENDTRPRKLPRTTTRTEEMSSEMSSKKVFARTFIMEMKTAPLSLLPGQQIFDGLNILSDLQYDLVRVFLNNQHHDKKGRRLADGGAECRALNVVREFAPQFMSENPRLRFRPTTTLRRMGFDLPNFVMDHMWIVFEDAPGKEIKLNATDTARDMFESKIQVNFEVGCDRIGDFPSVFGGPRRLRATASGAQESNIVEEQAPAFAALFDAHEQFQKFYEQQLHGGRKEQQILGTPDTRFRHGFDLG